MGEDLQVCPSTVARIEQRKIRGNKPVHTEKPQIPPGVARFILSPPKGCIRAKIQSPGLRPGPHKPSLLNPQSSLLSPQYCSFPRVKG
jgi:hypothetical protein